MVHAPGRGIATCSRGCGGRHKGRRCGGGRFRCSRSARRPLGLLLAGVPRGLAAAWMRLLVSACVRLVLKGRCLRPARRRQRPLPGARGTVAGAHGTAQEAFEAVRLDLGAAVSRKATPMAAGGFRVRETLCRRRAHKPTCGDAAAKTSWHRHECSPEMMVISNRAAITCLEMQQGPAGSLAGFLVGLMVLSFLAGLIL